MTSRVLIVIFDALRPEFVTPDLMPNLHGFAGRGARFTRARSTFPTETRVNQSAVTTGCMPVNHGIVGNKFVADDLQPGLLVNSGDDTMLEAAFNAGPVLRMPSMGQRLTAAGKRFAALSAGTPGGGRLINWSAQQDDTFRLAMRRPEAAWPQDVADDIAARIGPMPDYALPATDWISWAVSAYLDYVEPQVSPDTMLLWLCEPDESFHWHGIGGPEARQTMTHADAEFGRILDRLGPQIDAGDMHIITLSDHGQITLSGERLNIADRLADAGFSTATKDSPDGNAIVALASAGGIWLRDRSDDTARQIVHWLRAQPWCGPLFARDGLGDALPTSALRQDHARAPDISLVLRANDDANAHGISGSTLHDAPYPTGGGCHGGLHARELHTFLALGGASIPSGPVDTPAGNIDILPTVLNLLGLPPAEGIDGRALNGTDGVAAQDQVLSSTNTTGPITHLSVTDTGTARYLNRAWVEDRP